MSNSFIQRQDALDMTKQILELATKVSASDQPDLQARASQIVALARFMLYDETGARPERDPVSQ